ncbi:glycosyltransferase family 4 protein [Clostridium lacusfryxellense]|uniref:glycosyltransferase family 4 protein n=1 Tax=Clostridium lacusfryxellense TaxID=205328 RepID=UPI001C0BF878|nr:glycosyltransferase family 4 protein [Clostridium lacusfryxellense]MBU3111068.1 glycosyltransferase family 4 protein [Clostridium lacusfryxellense]
MKILMLVNWKVEYTNKKPRDKQPPDYYIKGESYWFYRYFKENVEVDVIDIHSCKWIENFEKNKIRFYIIQTLRAISKLKKYDLIVSHGMQSGVLLSLWRKLFNTKAKHIVFDIGSFNSAGESGFTLKLMQFASKSIDGVIYHTSSQIDYYKKFFPWIIDKSKFIKFGTDLGFFKSNALVKKQDADSYILCVGYSKRDWDTLVKAYQQINTDKKLRLVGKVYEKYKNIKGVEQIPFVPINDLINQVYNALFCVLPLESFNYSYGQMTLMQQMALGKCVIAAKVPSLVDYVEDGLTAIFYEPKNIEDCKNKMVILLNDTRALSDTIGRTAVNHLNDICNEMIMANEIEDFFTYIYSFDVN